MNSLYLMYGSYLILEFLYGYLLMCLDLLGVIFPDTSDSLFNKTAFMTPRKVHIVNKTKLIILYKQDVII